MKLGTGGHENKVLNVTVFRWALITSTNMVLTLRQKLAYIWALSAIHSEGYLAFNFLMCTENTNWLISTSAIDVETTHFLVPSEGCQNKIEMRPLTYL